MTQEKHQNPSQTGKLPEERPIMRRSRSLSELPGHLRVPILKRKDTERTQARLEAGAAGVEELRALREQHQQLIHQTMAAVEQKRKRHPHERNVDDHHRLQRQENLHYSKQQIHSGFMSPLSAWHSTSSLAIISEEWDKAPDASTNRNLIGNSVRASDKMYCQAQHYLQQLGPHQDHHNQESDCSIQHHSLQKQRQHNGKMLNHSQEKTFKSGIVKIDGLTSITDERIARYNDPAFKTTMNAHPSNNKEGSVHSTHDIHGISHSVPHDYIPYKENGKMHNPIELSEKQRQVNMRSRHLSQGKSQSVQENFLHPSDAKENESEGNIQDQNRAMHLHGPKPNPSSNYLNQYTTECEQKDLSHPNMYGKPTVLYTTAKSPLPASSVYLQSRMKSKSISWDNLLVVIGLQSESSAAASEIMEQDSENYEVFINVAPSITEHLANSDTENGQAVQRKKMRSQSFTSGFSSYSSFKNGVLKAVDPAQGTLKKYENINLKKIKTKENEHSEMVQRDLREHQKQTTKETNPASLLRRASIQCEAVLTSTPRKRINPLQDVDISSLRSPGPLHAVTLQYSSFPMRKISDSSTITACSRSPVSEEKHLPQKISPSDAGISYSTASKHTSHSLQPKTENDQSSLPMSQQVKAEQKVVVTDPSHLKMDQQCTQQDHPISRPRPVPRPRTSILKASLSEHVSAHVNCSTDTSCMHNMTSEFLNKTTHDKENSSEYNKADRSTSQSTAASDSNSPIVAANKEPTCLTDHQCETDTRNHTNNSGLRGAERMLVLNRTNSKETSL